MFTGIVKGLCPIAHIDMKPGLMKYGVLLDDELLKNLELGASISINGVCQTVVAISDHVVYMDAIQETLDKTTLKSLQVGDKVNVERSARLGDEIGGHLVSGHVYGTALIRTINNQNNNHVITLNIPSMWTKYLFPKGFVSLDGISLTIAEVDRSGSFTVHIIPETLARTTLGFKRQGEQVNIEFDAQTQTIVDTIERLQIIS